jgi:hypothetical protein
MKMEISSIVLDVSDMVSTYAVKLNEATTQAVKSKVEERVA